MPNKIIFAVIGLLVVGGGFLFRAKISDFLQFSEPVAEQETLVAELPKNDNKQPPIMDMPQAPKTSSGAPAPHYKGRDPQEVRSVPEEVKLFTDGQREQLYSKIREEGGSVKTNPVYFQGWIQLGLLKKIIGDFEGARDAWEYASLIEPLNSLSFSNLGELYWRYLHQYPKSEANLKIATKHKPDDVQNYVSLAELYHYSYKEKYDLSDDVLLDGLKANPGNETLMRRLAHLYDQRDESANALTWWQKVLEKKPEDQGVQDKISKLKTKLGMQ